MTTNQKSLSNTDVFLIVLEGQGDVDVGLVNQETWNWIHSDYKSEDNSYKEDIPQSILDTYDDNYGTKINVSIGSFDNDRALQSPKISFSSIKDAMSYIQENNCKLVDEFFGCIY